jgi:hypothetical protein
MKTKHEPPLQFSGYPLRIADPDPRTKNVELAIIKLLEATASPKKAFTVNDPENWDVDWFNSYE